METIEQLKSELLAARAEVEAKDTVPRSRYNALNSDWLDAKQLLSDVRVAATTEIERLSAQLATAKAASQGDRDFRLAVEEALAKEAGDTQINAVEVLVSVLNERDRLRSDLAKANAAVEVLSTARTAIERSLEGAASFDGYYRHHRNAIAMMDKLGVKPVKENNDHGF